jgi:hypothetical protein
MAKKLINPRIVVKGDTVYELSRNSNTPRRVFHGKEDYFRMREKERISRLPEEEQELLYHEELEGEVDSDIITPQLSPHDKMNKIRALAKGVLGNQRKLAIIEKADGLNKDIAIDETPHDQEKKKQINDRYRKKKIIKTKSKRKIVKKVIKKCRCKK